MTTTSGVFLNDQCIVKGDMTGFFSARSILLNKDVDVAVLETARGGSIQQRSIPQILSPIALEALIQISIFSLHIEGYDYRVCVVDGDVIAVSRRNPPMVKGDGVSTIKELIEILNSDESRCSLTWIMVHSNTRSCINLNYNSIII